MIKEYKNEIQEIDDGVTPAQRSELKNIFGNFEVVSAVPTAVPTRFDQQIKIYVSGGTSRLYIYDTSTATWKYTALT